MGKRKYERIELIENINNRQVTYVKRAKGLVKKSIELSVLCDQEVFLFIYDKNKDRVIHFHSDPNLDIKSIFKQPLEREFLCNNDYYKVGGEQQEWDTSTYTEEDDEAIKKYLKNQWSGTNTTSSIGDLHAAKAPSQNEEVNEHNRKSTGDDNTPNQIIQ